MDGARAFAPWRSPPTNATLGEPEALSSVGPALAMPASVRVWQVMSRDGTRRGSPAARTWIFRINASGRRDLARFRSRRTSRPWLSDNYDLGSSEATLVVKTRRWPNNLRLD